MEYDFSGYATKANVKCTDGRVIMPNAFAHQDGARLPLLYQHLHNDPSNILGHVVLENRKDGVYAYGRFNNSPNAQDMKEAVMHGDIDSMSIFANNLNERGNAVQHGDIKEVSLVLAGANKGAVIDNLIIQHSDGEEEYVDGEAIITFGEALTHAEDVDEGGSDSSDEDDSGKTVEDVVNSMNEEQKTVMYALIAAALEEQADEEGESMAQSEDLEGKTMNYNVFEQNNKNTVPAQKTLTHDEMSSILAAAQECGSFKKAVLAHAASYGIENIEILFPDARNVTTPPEWIKRRTEWVAGVINGARHSPFSRIKSMTADITADEARARGYIKGNKKVEEVFPVMQRVTTPTTIYKKQKLDRDDIIDITDFDVVSWIRQEMRMMLDEEIARAILIGDGRPAMKEGSTNPDKIDETHIRPIWTDDELYAPKIQVDPAHKTEALMEDIVRAMDEYEGSGSPTMYTTQTFVTDMLLLKDSLGRRLYNSEAEIMSFLGVGSIVKVPLMKGVTREADGKTYGLKAIITNISDYTIGADKGGEITSFDDFDIDYNQYKYLLETRISGCLTHPKSAVIVEQEVAAG